MTESHEIIMAIQRAGNATTALGIALARVRELERVLIAVRSALLGGPTPEAWEDLGRAVLEVKHA